MARSVTVKPFGSGYEYMIHVNGVMTCSGYYNYMSWAKYQLLLNRAANHEAWGYDKDRERCAMYKSLDNLRYTPKNRS